MDVALRKSRVDRRVRAAEKYLKDAALLHGALNRASDTAYQIELLAFEILLKATVLAYGGTPTRSHQYRKLFDLLPDLVQSRIIERAANRMGPHANYSDVAGLLTTFTRNFEKLRYDFEDYDEFTDEKYEELGREWLAAGALLESGTFVHRSTELSGFVDALQTELEDWRRIH